MDNESLFQGARYIVEVLTPRVSFDAANKVSFDAFFEKSRRALHMGWAVSIPDNPLAHLRVPALSAVGECGRAFEAERLLVNLNTFHTKKKLDAFPEEKVYLSFLSKKSDWSEIFS